jgi:hypothetical protein
VGGYGGGEGSTQEGGWHPHPDLMI